VVALVERFGVSERRACKVTGQHRSTQRLACRPIPDEEDKLRRLLRTLAREYPRWGWKTAHSILRREGWSINRKRTQRLWTAHQVSSADKSEDPEYLTGERVHRGHPVL
jgi:hypothetical protein